MTRSNSGVSRAFLVRLERLDGRFDHGKPLPSLPRAAQCLCQLERDDLKNREPAFAIFVEAGAHEPDSGDAVPPEDGERSLIGVTPRQKAFQGNIRRTCGTVEQHGYVAFHRVQMPGQQGDRARRHGQRIAHRKCMTGGLRLLDAGFGVPHCPIRKSQQPQNPRKVDVRHHAMIDRKIDEMRPCIGSDRVGQRPLEVTPCAGLVAQMVPGGADHPLTHRAMVRVRVS